MTAEEQGPREPREQLIRVYAYRDETDIVIAEKGRFERMTSDGARDKTFKWRSPGSETWDGSPIAMGRMPLYGLQSLLQADQNEWVYFVEGEKAQEACTKAGLLAVCAGTGATRNPNLRYALQPLAGRRVALWPDNDPIGHAYMQAVQAILRPIAREVRIVTVPMGPKEDAYDFFALGNTVDDLGSGTATVSGQARITRTDAAEIYHPNPMGGSPILLSFTEMQPTRKDFSGLIAVEVDGRRFRSHINLWSQSGVTGLITALNGYFGKDYEWRPIVHDAFSEVEDALRKVDPSIDVNDIELRPGGGHHLVEALLPAASPVILYGRGSAGKTYVGMHMAYAMTTTFQCAGLKATQAPVLWLDYETNDSTFRGRMNRVELSGGKAVPKGMLFYVPSKTPLTEMVDALDNKVTKEGIQAVIIDSAAAASGLDMRDEATPVRYFQALKNLGVASMTLAHVNSMGTPDRPFGSIFWVNEPRRAWYAHKFQDSTTTEILIGLYCYKSNEGAQPAPLGLSLTFDDPVGAINLRQFPPANQAEEHKYLKRGQLPGSNFY